MVLGRVALPSVLLGTEPIGTCWPRIIINILSPFTLKSVPVWMMSYYRERLSFFLCFLRDFGKNLLSVIEMCLT